MKKSTLTATLPTCEANIYGVTVDTNGTIGLKVRVITSYKLKNGETRWRIPDRLEVCGKYRSNHGAKYSRLTGTKTYKYVLEEAREMVLRKGFVVKEFTGCK